MSKIEYQEPFFSQVLDREAHRPKKQDSYKVCILSGCNRQRKSNLYYCSAECEAQHERMKEPRIPDSSIPF